MGWLLEQSEETLTLANSTEDTGKVERGVYWVIAIEVELGFVGKDHSTNVDKSETTIIFSNDGQNKEKRSWKSTICEVFGV